MAMNLNGQEILGFRITEFIGEGGMATVWKASKEGSAESVAIKVLDPVLARDPESVERFRREASVHEKLRHPNVVTAEAFCMEPLAIVMEYVEGRSLSHVIGREVGPIPIERAAPLMRQLFAAVAHAHEAGVIHRDIKPSNVLVSPDGVVKMTDFGIAKVADSARVTRTGTGMGTAAYMSPEQIKGAKDADARSDIYSLGVTCYEMLAGRTPFGAGDDTESDFAIRLSQVQDEPPDPRSFYPAIPEPVVRVVLRAMAKDPAVRFQTVGEFGAAMEAAIVGAPLPAPVPRPPIEPNEPASERNRKWLVPVLLAGALILVAVAVTALVVGSGKKSHRPPMQYAASSVRPAAKEAYPAKKSYPMAAAKAEIPKAAPRPAPKADKKAVAVAKPDSPRPVVAAVEKKATPAPVRVVKISPGEEARRAYQATLNAYNSGTSYDYFSHFSPWLDCWYASSGKSLDFLRSKRSKHFTRAGSKRSRFTDISIQVVSSSSDRVVLREGSTLRTTTKNTSVRRGILMKKMGGVWKVAGEVGPDADRCLPGVF